MRTKPTHEHDCNKCEYVTSVFMDGGIWDWYVCRTSVIGRYGSDGPAYWSSDISTITRLLAEPSYAPHLNTYAWSGTYIVALYVLEMYRTNQG